MTNQINQRVTDAINIALEETRRAAINDCVNVIWAKCEQYERLLGSKEARAIYENAYGEKVLKLYDRRISLRKKIIMLTDIASAIYDLKWQKQEK